MRGTAELKTRIKASNSKDLGGTRICIRAAIGHTILDIVLFGHVEAIIYDINILCVQKEKESDTCMST